MFNTVKKKSMRWMKKTMFLIWEDFIEQSHPLFFGYPRQVLPEEGPVGVRKGNVLHLGARENVKGIKL